MRGGIRTTKGEKFARIQISKVHAGNAPPIMDAARPPPLSVYGMARSVQRGSILSPINSHEVHHDGESSASEAYNMHSVAQSPSIRYPRDHVLPMMYYHHSSNGHNPYHENMAYSHEYHYPSLCMPYYLPWGFYHQPEPTTSTIPIIANSSTTLYGQISPLTTVYDESHKPLPSPATVIITSGSIPDNCRTIVLIPRGMEHSAVVSQDVGEVGREILPNCVSKNEIKESFPIESPSISHAITTPHQCVNISPCQMISNKISNDVSQILTACLGSVHIIMIERNVYKQWFDKNLPEGLRGYSKLKKYKSSETFMHWASLKKRRNLSLKLIILIRISEARNLFAELDKVFPESLIQAKVMPFVFAYEHLFRLETAVGGHNTTPVVQVGVPKSISVSHCLEDALEIALKSNASKVMSPLSAANCITSGGIGCSE